MSEGFFQPRFSSRPEEGEADARRDDEAEADVAAGRTVLHAEVAAWLTTWGTEAERPIPPEWLK